MLKHPTLDQLNQLGLTGMAHAFAELDGNGDAAGLGHAEWLALLLDHEATWRNDRRLALRLRHAKLRHHAVPEDVDYRSARGLDRRLFETLLKGNWIAAHENLAIIGPAGVGKSWTPRRTVGLCPTGRRRRRQRAGSADSAAPIR
jgi:DNA replication protein DnaC